MNIGDNVVRKSHCKDITFKVVDIKNQDGEIIYVLSGINLRIMADSPESDLEVLSDEGLMRADEVFNVKVKASIKNILSLRNSSEEGLNQEILPKEKKNSKTNKKFFNEKGLFFGRPGKILHVDGDARYLDQCLKVYKQLGLSAEGRAITERNQPSEVVDLVKYYKVDIVVITGHDGMIRGNKDYSNLENYRNSKYFVEAVSNLRDYEPDYDNLVIFAGACQSCYEAILDSGANFASSPNRVLIHCLDPVFICEKIAYTTIDKIVNTKEAIENTITGISGIGGLQTRGKYREGYPKSTYI